MKTTISSLLIVFGLTVSLTQAQGVKMSVEATNLLHEAENLDLNLSDKSTLNDEFVKKHKIYQIKNKAYVGGLIKVNKQLSEAELAKMNIISRTKAGNIWTVSIPVDQLKGLATLKGVDYVQLSKSVRSKLDVAVSETNADDVHAGMNISSAFMGKDVVVGVIDGGFDYTHPAFYDTSATENRIKRVWNNSGTAGPPAGFQFGSEFHTTASIEAAQNDGINDSHGTHVAGIAAGAGYGDHDWNGVAPMSDIIMVSTDIPTNGVDNVIDGISYIFQYAAAEGKPAVINLSLGSHVGPHDGSSLFDQALNNLVGPSKIVVGAAGNEGSTKLHLSGPLTNTDTAITFVGNAGYEDGEAVDIWGESGKQFKVSVALYDTLIGDIEDQSSFYVSNSNTLHEISLVDSFNDTCLVAFTTNGSEFNMKPHILMQHYNKSDYPLVLAITAVDASASTIHMWNHANGNGAALYSHSSLPSSVEGNTEITVGEVGGTADSIITVGAYTTKNTYTNIQNNTVTIPEFAPLGEIAPFSSLGPTVDNRIKPEITAPGNVVVSAINSFDSNMGASSENVAHSQVHNGKSYYFAGLEGTSMATPMVTGIIALWLENYPNLSTNDIKTIFSSTSRTDAFTGSSLPDNTWGHGKIDAYAGLIIVGLNEEESDEAKYTIYPNPAQDRIHILSEDKMQEIMIYTSEGKLYRSIPVNAISKVIDVSDLDNGVYLLRVRKENSMSTRSIVIAH